MTQNRIDWIDYSKTILIIFVVLAHCPFIPGALDVLICGFHMPAFFIISGYLHRCQSDNYNCIKKNFKRLIIPALLFSALCYVFWLLKFLLNNAYSFNECILKPILGLFIYDRAVATPICGVIWFLVVLFLCFLLLDFTMHFLKRSGLIILALVFVIITTIFAIYGYKDFQYGYYLQRTIISFPYVAFGFLCHEYNLFRRQKYNLVVACVLTMIYFFLAIYNGHVGIHSYTFGKSVFVYWIASIIGSLALFHWTWMMKKTPAWIVKISSGTIVVLCLHRPLISLLVHVWGNPYFITAAIIVLLYPMISVFNNYLPWFMGRSYSKRN